MLDIPISQRPRERLLEVGADHLSIPELLAILLTTGTKGKSVLLLAQELFTHFGGLEGLLDASIPELRVVKGIGEAKAIQLKAALAIARRCRIQPEKSSVCISCAQEAYEIAHQEIGSAKQEMALVLLRDVRGKLIHREQIAAGTLSQVLIHPREVFYPAVRHKAHSVILAHNHPSGDPTPSKADLELTRLLIQSGRVMGIHFDDHLIVGAHSYISLKERGYFGLSEKY